MPHSFPGSQIFFRPTTNWDETQLRFELYNFDPWSKVHSDDINVEREELDKHKLVASKHIVLTQLFQNVHPESRMRPEATAQSGETAKGVVGHCLSLPTSCSPSLPTS